jgi:hypothetical protein
MNRIMNAKVLFGASLAVNALLLGTVAYQWKQDSEDFSALPPLVVCIGHLGPDAVEKPVAGTGSAVNPTLPVVWWGVESGEYKHYVAHLRRAGCPEKAIRDIITADVNEFFGTRAKGPVLSANRFRP